MSEPETDALASLAEHDVDDGVKARIRRRGHVALRRSARLAKTPGLLALDRIYTRRIEPGLVGVAALVYIAWAIGRVLHIL